MTMFWGRARSAGLPLMQLGSRCTAAAKAPDWTCPAIAGAIFSNAGEIHQTPANRKTNKNCRTQRMEANNQAERSAQGHVFQISHLLLACFSSASESKGGQSRAAVIRDLTSRRNSGRASLAEAERTSYPRAILRDAPRDNQHQRPRRATNKFEAEPGGQSQPFKSLENRGHDHDQGQTQQAKPGLELNKDGQLPSGQLVRLVQADGTHRVLSYEKACQAAADEGTRVLVVSLTANPPVVKLESFVKSVQDEKKQKIKAKPKGITKQDKQKALEARRANTFKEVRIGYRFAENDLRRSLKLAQGILEQGYRCKVTYVFLQKDFDQAKQKFLELKEEMDTWGYLEQSDAQGLRQRTLGGSQGSFLVLLMPQAAKKQT